VWLLKGRSGKAAVVLVRYLLIRFCGAVYAQPFFSSRF
jgi:hypothetical protein